MGSPRILKRIINGRMTVSRPRRDHVEVLVYATDKEEGELVGEWEMPSVFRHTLLMAAEIAEAQTERKEN